jgi:hypothetical protein
MRVISWLILKPHNFTGHDMTREIYEQKLHQRCEAASEFLGAIAVGLIFAVPFLIEIFKELVK